MPEAVFEAHVDPVVHARHPAYVALVLLASGVANGPSDDASQAHLAAAEEQLRASGLERATDHPHIAAWRKAFSAMGAKPSRYPSSAEALMSRVIKGEPLPRINALVDLYNAVSVRHAVPLGGEDADQLEGPLRLTVTAGGEPFDPRGDGTDIEHVAPGEVVWRDDRGVTCRRWNWRQGRRTQLTEFEEGFNPEDLIEDEPMVITMTSQGFLKRTPLEAYRAQGRGGVGAKAGKTKEEDEAIRVFVAQMHDNLLFFTNRGRVYRQRVFDLPEAGRQARGTSVVSMLPLVEGEDVAALLNVRSLEDAGYFVFATRNGLIKRTEIREYQNLGNAGLIAINLVEDDALIGVATAQDGDHAMLATREGQAIRFGLEDVRSTGRASQGVKGIALGKKDRVVSLVILPKGDDNLEVLAVSEKGYGKRTEVSEYPVQGRGGKGVITFKTTDKVGGLAALMRVVGTEDLLVLSKRGIAIRTKIESISQYSRPTSGVRIMNMGEDDEVASAFVIQPHD